MLFTYIFLSLVTGFIVLPLIIFFLIASSVGVPREVIVNYGVYFLVLGGAIGLAIFFKADKVAELLNEGDC